MMKNRFDMVFESVMRSVITEDWKRFFIGSIIDATRVVTKNFTLPWVKGVTGKNVLRFLQDGNHSEADIELENPWGSIDVINRICTGYWRGRANGGDQFASDNYFAFSQYALSINNPQMRTEISWKVIDVGRLAYATYIAMVKSAEKDKANAAEMDTAGADEIFKPKAEITVKLTVTGKFSKNGFYGSTENHIRGTCEDYPGIQFDVIEGAAVIDLRIENQANCPDDRFGPIFDSSKAYGAQPGDVITFSGKVKSVWKEKKTVYMNYVKLVSYDSFVSTDKDTASSSDDPAIAASNERM